MAKKTKRKAPRAAGRRIIGIAGYAVIGVLALALGFRAERQMPHSVPRKPARQVEKTAPIAPPEPVERVEKAPLEAVERMPLPDIPRPSDPAWRRFAVPAQDSGGLARIAIVIDDLGPDRARSERAIALPPPVTLTFLPYASEVRDEAESARRLGHEILVHVPMEPFDRSQDMGPHGLAAGEPRDETLARLRWDLERFDGYVGINNHMGSRFTADADGIADVIDELKARGLLFLDSRTSAATLGARTARREGVPFAERDVFLDDDLSAAAVAARLGDTEAWARRHGTAIAIGHPHDATLAALGPWIETLPRKGFVLVPLSAIVEARGGALMHDDKKQSAAR